MPQILERRDQLGCATIGRYLRAIAPVCEAILRIAVNSVFFQCNCAVIRAGFWKQESIVAWDSLPSAGTILRTLSQAAIDGDTYDRALPQRIADTLILKTAHFPEIRSFSGKQERMLSADVVGNRSGIGHSP